MEQTEQKNIPYGERKLNELLDFACEQLYPTTGFTIELNGIAPSIRTQKELEAFSKVNLDPKTGATIRLAYDMSEDALILDSFRHPLDRQSAANLVIHRTQQPIDGLEYIAFIEVHGQTYIPKADGKDSILTNEMVDYFMGGYGIFDAPHPTHESYQLWRANLLSNCQDGWKVSEEVELFVDLDEHKTETIYVSNNQTYAEKGEISKVKKVSRVYTVHDENNSSSQQLETSITQMTNPFGQSINMRNELTKRTQEPFTVADPGIITSHQEEPIALNEDSFLTFQRLIEDTAHYLHEQKA
jgi:hypothetical protein